MRIHNLSPACVPITCKKCVRALLKQLESLLLRNCGTFAMDHVTRQAHVSPHRNVLHGPLFCVSQLVGSAVGWQVVPETHRSSWHSLRSLPMASALFEDTPKMVLITAPAKTSIRRIPDDMTSSRG